MNTVLIRRLTLAGNIGSNGEAGQLARRIAEHLGKSLADGAIVGPRREAIVDVRVPSGLSDDALAQLVAREIGRELIWVLMSSNFLHGAFVQFAEAFLLPVPNIIPFQFNPESIAHGWTPAQAVQSEDDNPLAVSGPPGETFDFTLVMDASEMILDGGEVAKGLAQVQGVYTRIAALEMLLQPTGTGAAGGLVGSISAAAASAVGSALGGGVRRTVPASQLPTVLFVWGPGRIVPVKVKSLTFTETLYDAAFLNPIHAEARVALQVLTPRELQHVSGPLAEVARMAYYYTDNLRSIRALANLANAAESAIGMLPVG